MAALVTACVAGQRRSMSGEVFQHPERFVGQAVSLCGYIHDRFEDANIWISRRAEREPHGLGLGFASDQTSHRPTPWDNRVACVTGRIERSGCGEGTLVCLHTEHAYELVLSDQQGPG